MAALTVAMPVYNGMPYLPDAVESILAQTFSDFAFVIVDDGSNDGSREYLEGLRDPRIILHSERHRGVMATRNRLLKMTETDICALMDADDLAMPRRLQTQWEFMKHRPDVVLLGTQIAFLAGNRTFARSPFPTQHSEIVRALESARPVVCNPSSMLNIHAVRQVGGYQLPHGEDFDLFLRLSEVGLLANLDATLHTYRIHLGSTFTTQYLKYTAYIAHAITCHERRLNSSLQPNLDAFMADWDNAGKTRQTFRRLDAWSALEFRRALLDLGRGARLRGTGHMIASALCRPRSAASQASSLLNQILAGSSPRNSKKAKSDKSVPPLAGV
jgi:glycosyltransferase involved in cell wall biosynthesis